MLWRIDFAAAGLIAGVKPTKVVPTLLCTNLGLNAKPRKSKDTMGYALRRRSSLQKAILVFCGCNSKRQARKRCSISLSRALLAPHCGNGKSRHGHSLERNAWELPSHPRVECIMQKEVCQQRTDHATLWRALVTLHENTIRQLRRRLQPPLDVKERPRARCMPPNRAHQEPMIDRLEKALDVEVQHPIVAPASLPGHAKGVFRRFSWPVSVRVRMEVRL